MALQVKLVVKPDVPGGFRPDTFEHLLQREVEVPGLDHRYNHRLIDARVAEDGNSAELTIHSEAEMPKNLSRGFRILHGTPPAAVRAVHAETGDILTEIQLAAPLQPGQRVQVDNTEYVVHTVGWPHRNENGICAGELDVQHVELHPVRPMPTLPWPKPVAVNPARQIGTRNASITSADTDSGRGVLPASTEHGAVRKRR